MSIRRRLFLALVLACMAGCALLGWRLTADLRMRFSQASEEAQVDLAEILAASVARSSQDGAPDVSNIRQSWQAASATPVHAQIYGYKKENLGIGVSITDRHGIVLWDSERPQDVGRDNTRWNDVGRTLAGQYGARATRSDPSDPATAVLHVAAPITRHGELIGVLTVSKPATGTEAFLQAARMQTLIICSLSVALGGLSAALATFWITRPISDLSAWVGSVRLGHRGPPPPGGPSEVVALSRAFSHLVEELEGRSYVERWAQQLAHEMKAPIAGLQAAAELLNGQLEVSDRERLLGNLRDGCERLSAMLERLLVLASVERLGQPVHAQPCPLPALVKGAVDFVRPLAERRNVAIALRLEEARTVLGDRFQLQQAVINLVQNAVEFSTAGGAVSVELAGDLAMASVIIRDRGPGISPGIQARLFERFASDQRPDGRKGTGLGLVLVKEVARIHGGSISLHAREGGGTEARLLLPGMRSTHQDTLSTS